MEINNKSIIVRADVVNSFPIHNGIYIHQLENDEFYTLEEGIATYIWTQLDGKKDLNQVFNEVAKLCRKNVQSIEKELFEFVEDMLEKEIVEIQK